MGHKDIDDRLWAEMYEQARAAERKWGRRANISLATGFFAGLGCGIALTLLWI